MKPAPSATAARIALLDNPILEYAWGSHSGIAELRGEPAPSARPQAELWMGAHPSASSRALLDEGAIPLTELIERQPEAVLGARVCERFGRRLPFLLKILAAARPLSIQAHPNAEQARDGFARENAQGIPVDAPQRSYRDASHKPELICALTPFLALRGFRNVAEIRGLLDLTETPGLDPARRALEAREPERALRGLLSALLEMPADRRPQAVGEAVAAAARLRHADPAFEWIVRLHDEHPGDVGVLAPSYLRLIQLEPGEALFLPARELHSYLQGVGIEIMANSDNVLRGGLTPKHVDVPELLRVLSFSTAEPRRIAPRPIAATESLYDSPAEEFALAVIRTAPASVHVSPAGRGVEILLCTEGSTRLCWSGGELDVSRGGSVWVPAAAADYSLRGGPATVYRASLPDAAQRHVR